MTVVTQERYFHYIVPPEDELDRLIDSFVDLKNIMNIHGKPVELTKLAKFNRFINKEYRRAVDGWMMAMTHIDVERPDHNPEKGLDSVERVSVNVGNHPELYITVGDEERTKNAMFLSFVFGEGPNEDYDNLTFVVNLSNATMYTQLPNRILNAYELGDTGATLQELPNFLSIAKRAFKAKGEGVVLRVNHKDLSTLSKND